MGGREVHIELICATFTLCISINFSLKQSVHGRGCIPGPLLFLSINPQIRDFKKISGRCIVIPTLVEHSGALEYLFLLLNHAEMLFYAVNLFEYWTFCSRKQLEFNRKRDGRGDLCPYATIWDFWHIIIIINHIHLDISYTQKKKFTKKIIIINNAQQEIC